MDDYNDYFSRKRAWAREMYVRDIEWQLYEVLRDGVNGWGDLSDEQCRVAPGFYGREWPDEV